MDYLLRHIQVNAPFRMLYAGYLDLFIEKRINPEIGMDANALDTFGLSDFRRAGLRLREHSLSVTLHAPFVDMAPGSPDRAIYAATRKRFEQVLRLVPIFASKTLICHAGFDSRRYESIRELWLERSISLWSWLAAGLRDEGCKLMLENVYEDEPQDIVPVLENLKKHGVGFCFDTGHQNVFSSAPIEEWLSMLGDSLGQLHLHDNDGSWDNHLALGSGTVDFQFLFQWLGNRMDSPPVITLEPHEEKDLPPSLEALERLWPWKPRA